MRAIYKFIDTTIRNHIVEIYTLSSIVSGIITIILLKLLPNDLEGIKFYYTLLLIGGAIFSGFAFIAIYKHTKEFFPDQYIKIDDFIQALTKINKEFERINAQLEKLYLYKDGLEKDEKSNIGIGLLALSTIFWQFGGILMLWPFNTTLVENLLQQQFSILNSACFLGIISTLQVSKYLPAWWENSLVKIFRRNRYIFISTLLLCCIQLGSFLLFEGSILTLLPALLFSAITIGALWICLRAVFKERKLKFNWLLNITMIITILAQLNSIWAEFCSNEYFTFYRYLIGIFYKVGLLLILFSLSYSWRYYIDKKTIKLLDNFKDTTIHQLNDEVGKSQLLKKQMNHAIRGSLGYLRDTVTEMEYEKFSRQEALEKIRYRIIFIYELHNKLHKPNASSKTINIGDFIKGLIPVYANAHGYRNSQFKVKMDFQDFRLLFDHARDIGIIVTELVINSIKALKNRPQEKREILVEGEITNETFVLRVVDNGPGYDETKIVTGYGQEVTRLIIDGFTGSISKEPTDRPGTKIVISIPIDRIKIN